MDGSEKCINGRKRMARILENVMFERPAVGNECIQPLNRHADRDPNIAIAVEPKPGDGKLSERVNRIRGWK